MSRRRNGPDELKRLKIAYEELFNSEAGQEVLHDIITNAGVFHSGMSPSPHASAFFEGKRSLAIEILEMSNNKERILNARTNDRHDHDTEHTVQSTVPAEFNPSIGL
jgi:hypothetical protein